MANGGSAEKVGTPAAVRLLRRLADDFHRLAVDGPPVGCVLCRTLSPFPFLENPDGPRDDFDGVLRPDAAHVRQLPGLTDRRTGIGHPGAGEPGFVTDVFLFAGAEAAGAEAAVGRVVKTADEAGRTLPHLGDGVLSKVWRGRDPAGLYRRHDDGPFADAGAFCDTAFAASWAGTLPLLPPAGRWILRPGGWAALHLSGAAADPRDFLPNDSCECPRIDGGPAARWGGRVSDLAGFLATTCDGLADAAIPSPSAPPGPPGPTQPAGAAVLPRWHAADGWGVADLPDRAAIEERCRIVLAEAAEDDGPEDAAGTVARLYGAAERLGYAAPVSPPIPPTLPAWERVKWPGGADAHRAACRSGVAEAVARLRAALAASAEAEPPPPAEAERLKADLVREADGERFGPMRDALRERAVSALHRLGHAAEAVALERAAAAEAVDPPPFAPPKLPEPVHGDIAAWIAGGACGDGEPLHLLTPTPWAPDPRHSAAEFERQRASAPSVNAWRAARGDHVAAVRATRAAASAAVKAALGDAVAALGRGVPAGEPATPNAGDRREAAANRAAVAAPPEPPFLGLQVDWENGTVRRDGFDGKVSAGTGTGGWHHFRKAFRAGEAGVSRDAVLNGYPGDSVGDGPRQAKTRMNRDLRVLGIEFAAGAGARLVEVKGAAEARHAA